MLEILKFVLKDFWTFMGFISILYVVFYFTTNGIVFSIEHISNIFKK